MVSGQLNSAGLDGLNETEKFWHRTLMDLTFGDEEQGSAHSCILSRTPCCSCCDDCYGFGTCCIDAYFRQHPLPANHYMEFTSRKVYEHPPAKCLPILSGLPGRHTIQEIMQVASCPAAPATNVNMTVRRLCETVGTNNFENCIINPTIVTSGRVFFRNKYCAECNGVPNVQRLRIVGDSCTTSAPLLAHAVTFEHLVNCSFHVNARAPGCPLLPLLRRPKIFEEWASYSPNCSSFEFGLCFVYAYPVVAEINIQPVTNLAYANRHYLACMLNISKYISKRCVYPEAKTIPTKTLGYSITILFNGFDTITEITKPCQTNEIYDNVLRTCTATLCLQPYVPSRSGCILVPEPTTAAGFNRTLPQVSTNSTLLRKGNFVDNLAWQHEFLRCLLSSHGFSAYVSQPFKAISLKDSVSLSFATQKSEEDNSSLVLSRIFTNVSYLYPYLQKLMLSSVPAISNWFYQNWLERSFPNHRLCSKILDLTDNVASKSDCLFQISPNFKKGEHLETHSARFLSLDRIAYHIEVEKNSTSYTLLYCEQFHLYAACPIRVHHKETFKILPNNSALINASLNSIVVLEPYQYVPLVDGIGSCITTSLANDDAQEDAKWKRTARNVVVFLSTAGAVLSLITSFCTIFAYTTYKMLRTGPGKNLISLAMAISISDFLILIWMHASISADSCKAIAICLHWSLLSQHFSCLVYVSSLTRALSAKVKSKPVSHGQFLLQNFAIWGLSAVLVLTCVLLDHYAGGVMQYGRDGICWIYSRNGRIYGYGVPAFGILLMNIGLLCIVMRLVTKENNATRSILKANAHRDDLSMISLGVKLCVLLGVLEIFGLLQISSRYHTSETLNMIFSSFYSVVRSLRGFFLFLGLTARKRVVRLITASLTKWSVVSWKMPRAKGRCGCIKPNDFGCTAPSFNMVEYSTYETNATSSGNMH